MRNIHITCLTGSPHDVVIEQEVEGKRLRLNNVSGLKIDCSVDRMAHAVIEIPIMPFTFAGIAKCVTTGKDGKQKHVSRIIYTDGTEDIYEEMEG